MDSALIKEGGSVTTMETSEYAASFSRLDCGGGGVVGFRCQSMQRRSASLGGLVLGGQRWGTSWELGTARGTSGRSVGSHFRVS
jgi:hypothetical protein